jgi:hypothetical protein
MSKSKEIHYQYLERLLVRMKDHPRILQARERLAPTPKVGILGKDVPSWQVEEEHADEVEGGRRMSQRIQEKEVINHLASHLIGLRTPAKTKKFSAAAYLQDIHEAEQEEI